jgi:hypothetical protein
LLVNPFKSYIVVDVTRKKTFILISTSNKRIKETCYGQESSTLQQGYIHPSNNAIYMEGGGEKEEEDQTMRSSNGRIKGGGVRPHEHQDQEEEEDEALWGSSKI